MRVVSCTEMRELDRRTIQEFGVAGEVLMDRAGKAVASAVRRLAARAQLSEPRVLLVAGKGNNGGDAFAAAAFLHEWGIRAEVWLAAGMNEIKGDALRHLLRAFSQGVRVREMVPEEECRNATSQGQEFEIIVDGILGTGIQGAPQGLSAAAIRMVNALGRHAWVVAIDVPSGLDADTGTAAGDAVRADLTVTMGFPKRGFIEPSAAEWLGVLDVVDIGIPVELREQKPFEVEAICTEDVRSLLPRRRRHSHKGDFGHVLIVSGAQGFAGAAAMASEAALRAGAGLVTAVVPRSVAPVVAAIVPEVMVHGTAETPAGTLSSSLWEEWSGKLIEFDVLLMGPGMRRHEETRRVVDEGLRAAKGAVVLDADALNAYENNIERLRAARCPLVITPHPGELARLLGCRPADVQSARPATAKKAGELAGATVVLKGAGTIVFHPGRPLRVNTTGNPGMATAGSGDVLSGMVAGLLSQGLTPFDAATAAVFLHGMAGDSAAWRGSEAGLIARDIVDEIPGAFRDVAGR